MIEARSWSVPSSRPRYNAISPSIVVAACLYELIGWWWLPREKLVVHPAEWSRKALGGVV